MVWGLGRGGVVGVGVLGWSLVEVWVWVCCCLLVGVVGSVSTELYCC